MKSAKVKKKKKVPAHYKKDVVSIKPAISEGAGHSCTSSNTQLQWIQQYILQDLWNLIIKHI